MNELRTVKIVAKPWGTEAWFAQVPGKYLGKVLIIKAGKRGSIHYHRKKEETMLVASGTLDYIREFKNSRRHYYKIKVGGIVHIPIGQKHSLGATEKDVMLLEASTYHPEDSVRVFDFFGRKCDE